ncbi:hypothetical protein ACQZ6I_20830 [Agrobacterium vitis]|uniref:hypothetical protein n=1 Tax=Agrobacterium vitis TaxID=373 RepID=UPI002DD41D2C|nr:hypothetical protein [Agrobacterium vitis]
MAFRYAESLLSQEIFDMCSKPESPEADQIAHLIEWHDGDARAAIATLLDDVHHLRQQLAIASNAISLGYTRGWIPIEEVNRMRNIIGGAIPPIPMADHEATA